MKWSPLIVGAAIAIVSVADAGVYKWKDPAGRTHFSDNPPVEANAESVKIRTFSGAAEVAGVDPGDVGAGQVVMLSTTWCGVCKRARAWLSQKGIPFTEHDVEKSEVGMAEYRRLNGTGVPIILVGKQRMNGFSADALEQMLKAK
ncbi:MAG: glutaredoxin family protein [Gammaproteobacteria bacterium]|nr:glutaredoxin family protein [Gammaproteobacteria bacterium]